SCSRSRDSNAARNGSLRTVGLSDSAASSSEGRLPGFGLAPHRSVSQFQIARPDEQTARRTDGYLKWVDGGEGREPTTLRARLSSHHDRRGTALELPPRSARYSA